MAPKPLLDDWITGHPIRAIVVSLLCLFALWKYVNALRKVVRGPGIGYGNYSVLRSWRGTVVFMMRPQACLLEGYRKYKSRYFKIATLREEYVLVSDSKKIAEYLAAPEDVLSFMDIGFDEVQSLWTIGNNTLWHTKLVSGKLTRNIGDNIPAAIVEINDALDKQIGSPSEFAEIPVFDIVAQVVAQVISQAFVGQPLCRNQAYLDNAVSFITSVVISAEMIRWFPAWLKPYATRLTPSWRRRKLAEELLLPVVLERFKLSHKLKGKPDDLLQWIVDASPPKERTVKDITERIMGLNVAGIHTTTQSLTSALILLAAEPSKYIPALRAELETCSEGGKFTKQTMAETIKLDSFLRESGRVNLISMIGLMRAARKEFRFKDGTVIPEGTRIGVPAVSIHLDSHIYPSPKTFDGFRFSELRKGDVDSAKYSLARTDTEYLTFGHGKHACPGRFFATAIMKMVLVTMLQRYDMKLAPGTKPKAKHFGKYTLPQFGSKILVKAVEKKKYL